MEIIPPPIDPMTEHIYKTNVQGRSDHDARIAEAVAYGFLLVSATVLAGVLLIIALAFV